MKTSSTLPDWSLLPEELLDLISKKLETCFDVVHARSVCTYWRSTFAFPSCLLRQTYSLPSLPHLNDDGLLHTLERLPLFLFRLHTFPPSEFFLGRIGRDESEDHTDLELPSPLQCSVKVETSGSDRTLVKMLDCQILPLGHHYRLTGGKWDRHDYSAVAFLSLNKEGGGEYAVLYKCYTILMARPRQYTSAEMRWKSLENVVPNGVCISVVAFRDSFYASFVDGETVAINPYSLVVTPLISSFGAFGHLVPSGSDELFLVSLSFGHSCRVSRLDEEAGKWVEVSDLGDRVLCIGNLGNFSCPAKEFPDGCGVSGNSIMFTGESSVNFFCKSGVSEGSTNEDLDSCWTFSREKRVMIRKSSSVLALRSVR